MQKKPLFALSLISVVVLVYLPGLTGPFIFDDLSNITNNSLLRIDALTVDNLIRGATSGSAGPLNRPVAMLSFSLNYYFAEGYNPFTYKLTNVLIQCLCACSLLLLCKQLLRLSEHKHRIHDRKWLSFAFVVTLAWAVHPINLTSVLYVVQRMTSLSTLFSLLCLSSYLASRQQFSQHGFNLRSTLLAGLSLLCWGLAMYSKENAIIIPVLIAWFEFVFFYQRPPWQWIASQSKALRQSILLIAGLLAILFLAFAIQYAAGGYGSRPFTMLERVLTEARVVVFYISLIFIPRINAFGLFHDDITISSSLWQPWTTAPSILLILVMTAAAFYFRKKNPLFALGIGWFFIGHSLESTFFPLEIAHEHRNHFPSIGLITAAISWFYVAELNIKKVTASLLCVALILGSTTWLRSTQWANYQRLAYFEAQHSPNSHAIQALLSNAAHKVGDIETATQAIKRAMELAPKEPAYALHYQNILTITGKKVPKDIQHRTLATLSENHITPSTELALDHIVGCIKKGPCSPLIDHYLEWTEIIIGKKPKTAYYHYLQGKAQRLKGDDIAALNAFQRAHELDEKYLHPLFEMADILLRAGQFDTAKTVLIWIDKANEKATIKRDKEIAQLKNLLQSYTHQTEKPKNPKDMTKPLLGTQN